MCFSLHMKDVYEGINNPNPVGKEADWHKSTPARFSHEIRMTKTKKLNSVEYSAEILSSKSNTLSVGKTFKVLTVDHQRMKLNGKNSIIERGNYMIINMDSFLKAIKYCTMRQMGR